MDSQCNEYKSWRDRQKFASLKRHIEKRERPDFRISGKIYTKLAKDAPSIGTGLQEWVQATSDEFNVTTDIVLDCVARYFEWEKLARDGQRYTESQKIAHLLGHNKGEVITRLGEMLYATKSELIYRQTKEGKFVELDRDGNPMVHEQPDWKAVGEAAKQLNQIHGSFAPEQLVVDMNQRVEVTHTLSIEEIRDRIAKLPASVRSVIAPPDGGSAQTGRRIESSASADRPRVLDVPLHAD